MSDSAARGFGSIDTLSIVEAKIKHGDEQQ